MRAYRDYLAENPSLPCEAEANLHPRVIFSRAGTVTVVGLGSPEEDYRLDEYYGLICAIKIGGKMSDAPLAELEVNRRGPERQLVEDYRYWFSNWR